MGYRYKPSRAKAREYAEQMEHIREFCNANGIDHSLSMDSYYFVLNGKRYRVSNHTIEASNRAAYDEFGNKLREEYHNPEDNIVCITAGKTRIEQIYKDLASGHELDKRGNRKEV